MASITARIGEQGNGFPNVGELVYHAETDTLYRVLRYSGIHTDGNRGNYIYAEIMLDDETILTEKEYENFSVDVELLSDE